MSLPANIPHKKRQAMEVALKMKGPFKMKDLVAKTQTSNPLCIAAVEYLISAGKDGKAILYRVTGAQFTAPAGSPNIVVEELAHAQPEPEMLPVAQQYNQLRALVRMVGNKSAYSLVVSGMAGVGKSYTVSDTLKALGIDVPDKFDPANEGGSEVVIVKGKSSPMGLYQTLHNNRDSLIIFDDCDSVFGNQDSTNLLKAALDFQKNRNVSWISMAASREGMDQNFTFTGRIIFITNKFIGELDSAIRSRAYVAEINLSKPQILEYLQGIYEKMEIYPGDKANNDKCTKAVRLEVIDFMEANQSKIKQFDLRTFLKGCQLRAGSPEQWKGILLAQVC